MILFDISASITLHGHNGPIYGLSFSPDRSLLLSCSEDGTIRLWSLQTWTCLVNYKVLCSLEMNNSPLHTVLYDSINNIMLIIQSFVVNRLIFSPYGK